MKYKGYELMQEIAEGKIKEESRFLCSTGDTYVYHDNYGLAYFNNDSLEEENAIDCNYAYSIWLNFEFELLEDKEEIDIQEIEQLSTILFITTGDNKEIESFIKKTNKIVIDNFYTVNNIINKQNELIKAVKQIDKQIHCKICGKELTVKYGLCEKCYEAANEDVR